MAVCIITGCAGLVGSEAVRKFHSLGYRVIGIDNNSRKTFFGESGSTETTLDEFFNLREFEFIPADIRNFDAIKSVFENYRENIEVVIHCAAQPAHVYSAAHPLDDFAINAYSTVNLLELTRQMCPSAVFIFCSSSKVYGDSVNRLPLIEYEKRLDVPEDHPCYLGIPEDWPVDQSNHSVYGAGKLAADIYCQEYAYNYGLRTNIVRPGCLSGPNHMGVPSHGFLSWLVRAAVTNQTYIINGYKGKQVRDNIHSSDLVNAFWLMVQNPGAGEVYNLGGGRESNCSILEAIDMVETSLDKKMAVEYSNTPREGDHKYFIGSDVKFKKKYTNFKRQYSQEELIKEICEKWKNGV